MPDFPAKPTTYQVLWSIEFDEFVAQHYNKPWSIQQGEMLGQDTYRVIEVNAEQSSYGDEAQARLDAWLAATVGTGRFDEIDFERNNYLPVEIVLWDLCRNGVIESGDYLILVSW